VGSGRADLYCKFIKNIVYCLLLSIIVLKILLIFFFQPAQLPDVVSTLPAFSHRPDQQKMLAGVEPHLRFPIDYPFFNFQNLNRSPTSMPGTLMSGLGGRESAISGSGSTSDRNGSSSGGKSSSSQEDRSKDEPDDLVSLSQS
jgi:hypothetical protein